MSTRNITLAIRPRGKPVPHLPEETTVSLDDSTEELYKRLAGLTGLSVHRLRITKGSDGSAVARSKDASVDATRLRHQSIVYVKGLGPQIGWRTVFVIEYLGPLLIHPLFYFVLRPRIYSLPSPTTSTTIPDADISKDPTSTSTTTTTTTTMMHTSLPAPSPRQTLALALITPHFLKRELETLFVHRFSAATMPARNILKNSFHYWVLAGANLAYWIYSPSGPTAVTTPTTTSPTSILSTLKTSPLTLFATALFLAAELANLSTHLTLRNLRQPGSTSRGIPRGPGFDWVTCPNYTSELAAWVGVALVTRSWAAVLFLAVAGGQMALWARKKERRYRWEFGKEYGRKRWAMLPGVV